MNPQAVQAMLQAMQDNPSNMPPQVTTAVLEDVVMRIMLIRVLLL
jgi:hypothetical protein